jgi:hypothetical protein
LFFFVTNWDYRCVHRYCFASEQLDLLKTKYFSERSLFVSWHSPFASPDKVDASFASAGGWGGFTGTLGMYEFFSILSLLRFFQHFKIEVINIIYGWNILPIQCKFIFLLHYTSLYFIYHNKCNDYYQISSEKRHLLMSKILGIE